MCFPKPCWKGPRNCEWVGVLNKYRTYCTIVHQNIYLIASQTDVNSCVHIQYDSQKAIKAALPEAKKWNKHAIKMDNL